VLVGYAATGLHTNGYTLARHVLFDAMKLSLDDTVPDDAVSVADALLAVHRSYDAAIRPALHAIHGMAHITGGGIAGNLVRVLPEQVEAVIDPASWQWPPLFRAIADGGKVTLGEMREVFNLGVGMIAAVPPSQVDLVQAAAAAAGVQTWILGECRRGARAVRFAD
jgi:phosphoribosylformylglycinamidine cyclo-ligase